jgi:vesicular inhibitory amino acid transporter
VLLAPLTLLPPGHVWGTAIIAVGSSIALAIVIIILCYTDASATAYKPVPTPTFTSFGQAFGAILFGFGGHCLFPVLQSTMQKPKQFRKAIGYAYVIVLTMYISVSTVAVVALGGSTSENVLTNFSATNALQKFGVVCVTAHLLFAVVTIQMPVGQILDHYFCVTQQLGAKQLCLRVTTIGLVAVTLWGLQSKFFCVIGLVGGTTTNLMTLVFPPLFYVLLLEPEKRTWKVMCVCVFIILLGLAALVASVWGAVGGCQ